MQDTEYIDCDYLVEQRWEFSRLWLYGSRNYYVTHMSSFMRNYKQLQQQLRNCVMICFITLQGCVALLLGVAVYAHLSKVLFINDVINTEGGVNFWYYETYPIATHFQQNADNCGQWQWY